MAIYLLAALTLLQTPDAPAWPVSVSAEGGYSIAFPATPEHKTEKASSPNGPVDVPTLILQKDEVVYAIFHHDDPTIQVTSAEKFLDGLRDGRKAQGEILGEKPWKVDGNPGREVLVETPKTATSPACLHRVRFVLVKSRMYQMMVVCPLDRVDATADDAKKFFDSFTLGTATKLAGTGHLDPLAGWIDFRSDTGRFEVRVPRKPTEETQKVETGAGMASITIFTASDEQIGYIITCRDVDLASSRKPKLLFDGLRDLVAATSNGTLLGEERTIHLGRASGREFRAEVPLGDDPKGAILQCKLYLSGRRLYQVMAIYPKAPPEWDGPEAFFRSFRIRPLR